MTDAKFLKGVIRARTIQLEKESGLRSGQPVKVIVWPVLLPLEGLRRGFGSWADDGEQLDRFLEETYRDRG